MARHDAAGEEMLGDPVGLVAVIEAIGLAAVAEDMDEQPPVGRQPRADALQQGRPVGHMLEHLDRNDAVELTARLEVVHVGGDDREIGQAPRLGFRLDVEPLRRGIRDRGDFRVRDSARP